MTNQFQVNQQIVCIDDTTHSEQYLGIRKGETYTIRWLGMHKSYLAGDYLGVRLVGIERGTCPEMGDIDPPYRASRFRPVVTDRLASLRGLLAGGPIAGEKRVKENVE